MRQIAHALVRLTNTPDGQLVLKYLRQKVWGRILAPDANTNELWYLEGQRAFVTTIDNLIELGKKE